MRLRLGYPQVAPLFFAVALLAGCGGTSLPGELQGRWLSQATFGQFGDRQAFVFRGNTVEYDYATTGGITDSWTDKVTNAFTTSDGVNIIETDGPPRFAWHVVGTTLYLAWVNQDQESELLALGSSWWETSGDLYTKY